MGLRTLAAPSCDVFEGFGFRGLWEQLGVVAFSVPEFRWSLNSGRKAPADPPKPN